MPENEDIKKKILVIQEKLRELEKQEIIQNYLVFIDEKKKLEKKLKLLNEMANCNHEIYVYLGTHLEEDQNDLLTISSYRCLMCEKRKCFIIRENGNFLSKEIAREQEFIQKEDIIILPRQESFDSLQRKYLEYLKKDNMENVKRKILTTYKKVK